MPNNNPDGYNAFGGPMEREMPYGDIAKLRSLTRLAPSAQKIPQKMEKRAPRKRAKREPEAQPMAPPTQPTVPYEQVISSFWVELASEPGASPLIQEIARRASGA